MRKINSTDGTSIAFFRTGNGPPLLLVHGGAANDHRRWELAGVRSSFAENFTVYAMDCRGRGESGDSEIYNLEREFEDVAAVADAIEEPVAVLGHSLGALLAMEAALLTNSIHKLILYEPPVSIGSKKLIPDETFVEIKNLLDENEKEEALLTFLREVGNPEEIEKIRAAPTWQYRVDSAHTAYRERLVFDYVFDPARFSNLSIPTLMILGSESPPYFKMATEAVHNALPNSRISIFDGHAHAAMLTATEKFINEVVDFIRE